MLWLWLANFIGLSAFAFYLLVLNAPPSQATLALHQALTGVTEIRIRVGCISSDSGSSKKIVRTLNGAEVNPFIQALRVEHDWRVFTPMACNLYTFEFYRQDALVAEIGYYSNLLVWHDSKGHPGDWHDGRAESGRALTWRAKRYLSGLLTPYERIRRKELYKP